MRNWLIFITLLVVGALFVPAVSAAVYVDETITEIEDTSGVYSLNSAGAGGGTDFNSFRFADITLYRDLSYIGLDCTDMPGAHHIAEGEYDMTYTLGTHTGPARVYIQYSRNALGVITHRQHLIFFDDWDIGSLTGPQCVKLSTRLAVLNARPLSDPLTPVYPSYGTTPSDINPTVGLTGTISVASGLTWKNHLNVSDSSEHQGFYDIQVTRLIDGRNYESALILSQDSDEVYYKKGTVDLHVIQPVTDMNNVTLTSPVGTHMWYLGDSGSADPEQASGTINLYVKNSQTGALIAGPRAVISAGFYEPAELIEVSNTTLAGGTKTYTLQPNGGGLPNPDYYRVSVTADGYNAEMPYADITLDAGMSMTMVMGMEPTAGGPEDPDKTYIDVYVRDIYANPIADATVKMGAYTLKTNAAGYTLFDVTKNATYPYTVKKTGYTSIEGSVTVADAARYPVNIVMGTGVIPTNTQTAEPTVPGATPTVPTGEETPGPGFMEQSGQSMATFFGVPLAIGKMILGLLIALAIGMATAKQLKGGAQEFGIGLLGGAMIGVVVGLIPTWVIVVLLLTVGLYIGKMYMSGDAGGR